jgi:hypothetical protein
MMSRNGHALLIDQNHAQRFITSLAILFAFAVVLPSIGHAQAENKVTRTIELEAVEGSPFIITGGDGELAGMGAPPPSAMVSFHTFGGSSAVETKFKAMPIRQEWERGAYALYITTGDSPADYVDGAAGNGRVKFNTDFNGTINIWGTFSFFLNLDAPQITAFVAYDPDDGRSFNPDTDLHRLIFVGTSIR